MKISNQLCEAMCVQIARENANANFYLNAAGVFHMAGLEGFAKSNRAHSDEEIGHSRKLFDFVCERNGLGRIKEVPYMVVPESSALAVYTAAYQKECETTKDINELYTMAVKENDYGAQEFLDWFAHEQVSEEREQWEVMQQLTLIGDDKAALVLYDKGLQQ